MNTLKILIMSLGLMIAATSCGDDDRAAEYNLVSANQIKSDDEVALEINISISDLDGLQQIIVENEELGIDFLENITTRSSIVNKNFLIALDPEELEEDTIFLLNITTTDINGNTSKGTINVDIL